jgi:allantoinase
MADDYPRDLVGYGANPPNPRWPGQARLALNFVMNYEEGSEYSVPDGDGFSEATLTEATGTGQTVRGRDLAAESMFEYGSRVGFWRLMRIFRDRGLPLTVFGCALALERNPEAAKAIVEAGHDVCCHGWRWVRPFDLSEDDERRHIHQAVASLTRTVGERPLGWYCRYGPSIHTRRLLVEEGGFLYDSDAYNDELPYWVRVGGKPHLVVPYSLATNDLKFGVGGFFTADHFSTFLKDAFDVLYREGETQPRVMSVGLHMRLVGHPSRSAGIERFLDYVTKQTDVWICRRVDIARHWLQHHPYPA